MTSIPVSSGAPGANVGRWTDLAAILAAAERVVVVSHIHPDGDALGSQLALVRILQRLGKTAVPILPDSLPDQFRFLDIGGECLVAGDPRAELAISRADCIAAVDVSRSDRLGKLMQPVLAAGARRVCIDHHAEGDFPAHAEVIDPGASSTGELVYELGRHMLQLDRLPLPISLPVYVAVLTDTGGFRFGNTHPDTHRLAAELLAAGVNPPEVHHAVYENVKPEAVRLLGMSLAGLKVEAEGRLAWLVVTQEHLLKSGARPEDVDGFVDHARSVGGVQMVVMFLELASGRLKVSLRSREPVNVQQLASRFGGGGHRQAAGILMEGPWAASREAVLDAARAMFGARGADS